MKVAIRTDASIQIGTGHVMRCLTLADELRHRDVEVVFVCREHKGNLCDLISGKGLAVVRLPVRPTRERNDEPWSGGGGTAPFHAGWLGADWRTDADETLAVLFGSEAVDWLVVDHYALDDQWESSMRSVAHRLMVIDDLADRPHDCDLLLDQNLFSDMKGRYRGLVPKGCRTLLGPQYALLRPEFRVAHEALRRRSGVVQRILISFGGVDATNGTVKALTALDATEFSDIRVDVVIGRANPHRAELERMCAGQSRTHLHVQTSEMAGLMAAADLAIGGGGVETWERCAVGCPALIVALADNQVPIAQSVAAAGAAFYLGLNCAVSVADMQDTVINIVASPDRLASASDHGLALVDGNGCPTVVGVLESMM